MSNRSLLRKRRSGIATIWIIAAGPALLTLFVLVTEIANIWQARIELRNAVEAGAQAGAKVWGDGADDAANRAAARVAARNFAEANLVTGKAISVGLNNDGTGKNASCDGDILLGSVVSRQLDTDMSGAIGANLRGCRVHVVAQVNSLWHGFGGPWHVQAAATARYVSGDAKLTQIDAILCP